MIALLTGILADKSAEGVIIDVRGVGYVMLMPLCDIQDLPALGEEYTAHVLTYVREDQITLYGFAEAVGKRIFKRLIGITGVGPRVALSILSTLTVSELNEAAFSGNTKILTKVPGIGAKKAQRLLLELKDALSGLEGAPRSAGSKASPPSGFIGAQPGIWDELRSALLNLGYNDVIVSNHIAAVHKEHPNETELGVLIRHALTRVRAK